MTFRQSRLKYWRKKKRPTEAHTKAIQTHCLSEHYHRSGLEAKTCDELRLRKLANDIKDYRVEVNFPLELDGVKLGTYRADFVAENHDGTFEIIEAKGIAFALWKQKWKILQGMLRNDPLYSFRVVTQ